ncbi:MAG: DUF4347 domain-containing protein [Rhizobacter sp.]|nr:DUF4347 domain-containing protein [Rhizobacter sp.]
MPSWFKRARAARQASTTLAGAAAPRPLMMPLEPRIMFDAALGATALDVAHAEPAAAPVAEAHDPALAEAQAPAAVEPARHEIVFVDASVQDPQSLLAQLGPNVEVVLIGAGQDGLQVMADTLAGRTGLDAIHVLSHGDVGQVKLGSTWLDRDGVGAQATLLGRIGQSLSAQGDILLYGCLTGADNSGRDFLRAIADATGADVAASNDTTGSALKQGDWDLEVQHGSIEATSLALTGYQGTLAAFTDTYTTDFGSGLTSFTSTLGGVSYTYTFTADGDGGDFAWDNTSFPGQQWLNANSAAPGNTGTTERFTITRTDGADFTLGSIQVDNAGGGSSVTVRGYLGGFAVGSAGTVNGGNTATLNFGSLRVDEVRVTSADFSFVLFDNFSGDTNPPNSAPTMGNLNGDSVAWAGVGSTVVLDASANATLADADFGALNSGNGNWSGGSLTVQRSGTAISADTFGFNTTGALFTVSGTSASGNLQSGGLTFGTYTNTGGVLTVSFTSSGTAATTALVNNVAQRITYGNDTPAGDATVRFSLSDGVASAVTADVTVTSDTIYVTNTTDTSTIDRTNGVSFSEAIAIAAADATGTQTIVLASSLAGQTVSASSASTLGESLTLDLDSASGATISGGTLSISSTYTLTVTNGSSDTATISTTLGGAGSLAKSGAGTVTLSGTNSYTGGTTVSAGTLTVSGGDAISSTGTVTVNSGATLALSSTEGIGNLAGAGSVTLGSNTLGMDLTADTTFSGGISGTGGLSIGQSGAATYALTLSGTNTYTGTTTTINYGWLRLNGDAALSDSSQLRINGNSRLTLLSDQTAGSLFSNNANASIILGSYTLTVGGDNTSTTANGVISGTGNLVKTGSGTLTLAGTNTYSGTTTVSAGTLSVASDSNLGSDTITLASGSTLDVTGATTIDNAIALSGAATVNNSAAVTLSGVISGSNNLTKTGSSTLTLSGTNTYSGTTTVSAGTLSVASDSNLGSGALTLAAGTTLDVTGATTIDNAIALSGAATVNNSAAVTLSGVISGSNNLTKTGSSTLTLSGTNTYSGTTTVSAGTLSVASDSNLGSGALTLASGTTLAVTGATTIDNAIALSGAATVNNSAAVTLSGVISGSNNLTKTGSSTLTLSGTNTYSGTTTVSAGTLSVASDGNLGSGALTLAAGTTLAITGATTLDNAIALSGAATLNNSGAVTLSGVVSGSNDLTKAGAGVLTMSAANTQSGTTTVNAGTLLVTGSTAGATTVASGATLGGTGTLGGAVTVQNGGTLSPGVAGAGTLTVNGDLTLASGSTLALDIAGATAGSGYDRIAVTGAVDVTGATLSATHSYTAGPSDTYTVITNDASDAVTGTFSGLAEGATATAGGNSTVLTASYLGGTGNDFTLTAPVPAAVTAVSASTANGTYGIGSTISVTLTFDNAVTVDTGGGTPSITLETGATDRIASYVSGSGSNTLTFQYTVQSGDTTNDLDYTATGALVLNGGTIRDALSIDAALTLPTPGAAGSLGANRALVIDGVRPTASIVVADNALAVGETSLVTITFNEAVTGFTNADLTVANGTLGSVSSSDGGITWTATFTPTTSVTDASNLITLDNTGVSDAAGNAGSGSTDSNNYAIDTTRPTASIVVADTALAAGETSLVTITFSEAVTGFTNADLTVANGALGAVSSSDGGITWTATFTPSTSVTDASNLITLANTGVTDAAGNTGTGTTDSNNYAIDTTRPTASIVVADTALAIGETSTVTITFSEAVTGFTNADLTVANGTLTPVSSSDGGITWTATFTPTASVTDATNLITLANTGVTDAAGNAGTGTTDSNNYAIDTTRPTASIVMADTALAVGETSGVTITFSEAVTGFTNADLTVANGTLSAVSSADGGITWTATFTPTASVTDTSNLITLDNTGVSDTAGNAGTGSTDSNNYAIDTTRPTAIIVVADTALAVGETSLVTITFSEAVTGFTNADLTVANGTLSPVSSSDGGITWTATLTPTASVTDATNLITLTNAGVTDAAGNTGTGTTSSNNYALDTERPAAVIVVADTALAAGETSGVTIIFSEAVTGFTNADLTVANGTLSPVSSSDGGFTWTATFTPTAGITDATNLITLANTGVTDAAGNAGTGTTDSSNYAIDTTRPTASIVVADTALAVGETSGVTITFSEAVSGFTNADLTVANGTLSPVSSSDGGVTWTATFTPTAGVTDATNLITLANTGVTDAAGNTGTGTTDSNNYAIDTTRPTASIVVADNALAVGETSGVTITFSEAVTGFTNADLTVTNGTLSTVTSSDGGITWTATFTPTAGITDATNLITLTNAGVTDAAGNIGTGTTSSNNYAIDASAPAVVSVAVPANGSYLAGQALDFSVAFSEAVLVDTAGGMPRIALTLDTGGTVYASYLSGSGTASLVFRATVASGQLDANGIGVAGSIDLNGGTLRDTAGNDSALTLTGLPSTAGVQIDAVAPAVTAVGVPADGHYNAGDVLTFTVSTSEAVTVTGTPQLTLGLGSGTGLAQYVSGSGSGTLVFQYTVQPGDNAPGGVVPGALQANGGTLRDAAGNDLTGTLTGVGSTAGVVVDTTAPAVASIVRANPSPTAAGSATYTVTFTEDVTGVDAGDFTLTTTGSAQGSIASVTAVDAHTYTVLVNGLQGQGDITLALNGSGTGTADTAGNAIASGFTGETYELRPPAVVVPTPSAPAPAEPPAPAPAPLPSLPLVTLRPTDPISPIPTPTLVASPPSIAPPFIAPVSLGGFDSFAPTPSPAAPAPARTGYVELGGTGGAGTSGLRAVPDIGDFSVAAGQPVNIVLPAGTFSSSDASIRVSVEVRLANGQPLPAWLKFDPVNGSFTGQPPAGLNQALSIEVIARDSQGRQATTHLDIQVRGTPARDAAPPTRPRLGAWLDRQWLEPASPAELAPIDADLAQLLAALPAAPESTGRASLAEQFNQFGPAAREAERAALLQHARATAAALDIAREG